jgi:hypothetical protein
MAMKTPIVTVNNNGNDMIVNGHVYSSTFTTTKIIPQMKSMIYDDSEVRNCIMQLYGAVDAVILNIEQVILVNGILVCWSRDRGILSYNVSGTFASLEENCIIHINYAKFVIRADDRVLCNIAGVPISEAQILKTKNATITISHTRRTDCYGVPLRADYAIIGGVRYGSSSTISRFNGKMCQIIDVGDSCIVIDGKIIDVMTRM